jgi:hypothetical protein
VLFRWNDWNIEHLAKHGVDPDEAEQVITQARAPYPMSRSDDKYLVWGRGALIVCCRSSSSWMMTEPSS